MIRPSRKQLSIALGAVACVLVGAAADRLLQAEPWRADPAPDSKPVYRQRLDHFRRLDSRPGVVLLGDSLTQWAEWHELLGPDVANRGIAGDTTSGLRRRLEVSVPASAHTVAIMIGTNDQWRAGWRQADSVADVSAILDHLAGRRVILQSVLYTANPRENARIDGLNRAYAALCATGRCEWLDLNPAVAPLGRLTAAETLDGRHLTAMAYQRWAAALRARLADGPLSD